MGDNEVHKVIIVGAGLAGIYCGYLLQKDKPLILEANTYIGGRVKSFSHELLSWKETGVDLGAEVLHGTHITLKRIVDENNLPCRHLFTWAQGDGEHPDDPSIGTAVYTLHGKFASPDKKCVVIRYDESTDAVDDIHHVNDVLWGLEEQSIQGIPQHTTLKDYLIKNGVQSERAIELALNGYANTLCSTLEKLSLLDTIKLVKNWEKHGAGDYRLDKGMGSVIKLLSSDLNIKLNSPIISVNLAKSKEYIELIDESNNIYKAEKVVIAVPSPILKKEQITFIPRLPEDKSRAIQLMNMENAIKILVVFDKCFWPKNLHGLVSAGGFVPEIWFDHPDRVGVLTNKCLEPPKINSNLKKTALLSVFCCAEYAEKISKMSEEEVKRKLLNHVNEIFGNGNTHDVVFDTKKSRDEYARSIAGDDFMVIPKIDPKPADTHFLFLKIQDWAKEKYVGGGYSSPSVGAPVELRKTFLQPIENRLYFCGEAMHWEQYMTMEGATESAAYVAERVVKDRKQAPGFGFGASKL